MCTGKYRQVTSLLLLNKVKAEQDKLYKDWKYIEISSVTRDELITKVRRLEMKTVPSALKQRLDRFALMGFCREHGSDSLRRVNFVWAFLANQLPVSRKI